MQSKIDCERLGRFICRWKKTGIEIADTTTKPDAEFSRDVRGKPSLTVAAQCPLVAPLDATSGENLSRVTTDAKENHQRQVL